MLEILCHYMRVVLHIILHFIHSFAHLELWLGSEKNNMTLIKFRKFIALISDFFAHHNENAFFENSKRPQKKIPIVLIPDAQWYNVLFWSALAHLIDLYGFTGDCY